MNNLAKMPKGRSAFRRKLLAGASVSSLVLMLGTAHAAAENENPGLWIELGAQFEHRSGEDAPFVPMFTQALVDRDMLSPLDVQRPPKYSFGGEGSLLFQPEGWDWKLSASIVFGRSNGDRHQYDTKTLPPTPVKYFHRRSATSDVLVHYKESHAILDFQAGTDVGLGLFGHSGSSSLNFGVRIAQFGSKESLNAYAIPTELVSFPPAPAFPFHLEYDVYTVSSQADRSFRGIGPAIRWNGSTPIAGSHDDVELTIDWSLQGSALFGRQKANLHLLTVDNYHYFHPGGIANHPFVFAADTNKARSVVIPNVGGSLALSVQFPNAKVTVGYRADEFLNAMDTGIDTRKTSNVLFHGPFASISVGISPFDL